MKSFDVGTVVTLTPAPGATYVFGGWSGDADCADGVVTLDADKTCTAAFNKKPDLTVISLAAPASTGAGLTITVTDTTKNLTGGPAFPGTSNTKFWLSADAVLGGGDTLLGARPVPSLNPGAASAGSTNVVIPAGTAPGSYFLIANADGDGSVPESNEGNNTRSKASDDPGPGSHGHRPVRADHLGGEPHDLDHGQDAQRRRRKRGTAFDDELLPLHRLRLGRRRHALRQPRGSCSGGGIIQSTLTTNQTLPASVAGGNYFIIAKADGPLAVTESNEANNTRSLAILIGRGPHRDGARGAGQVGRGTFGARDGHDGQRRRPKRRDATPRRTSACRRMRCSAATRSSGPD